MTRAQRFSAQLAEARRNPSYARGLGAGGCPFVALVLAGHVVSIDDGDMTGNGHRHRWLVVDGDHIGRRATMAALGRLATVALDRRGDLAALKSEEMDREDRAARRAP